MLSQTPVSHPSFISCSLFCLSSSPPVSLLFSSLLSLPDLSFSLLPSVVSSNLHPFLLPHRMAAKCEVSQPISTKLQLSHERQERPSHTISLPPTPSPSLICLHPPRSFHFTPFQIFCKPPTVLPCFCAHCYINAIFNIHRQHV